MLTATLAAWFILGIASASAEPVRAAYSSANVQFLPAFEQRGVLHTRDNPEDAIQAMMKHLRMERDAALDAYQLICESLNPLPREKGVELMAQWQAVALNVKSKRPARDYMDLRFVNEVLAELGQK